MLTYHLFVFSKKIKKYVAKKPFKTMNNIPKKVWLSVKKTRHHKTFSTPFITNKTTIWLGIPSLFAQRKRTMPAVIYITVHTIGIT